MLKCIEMNVNEIIVMVFSIASVYIVRNVCVLFQNTIEPDVSFHYFFVFTRHYYCCTITITKNNDSVLLAPFTICAIYTAVLKDEIVKYSKMTRLAIIFFNNIFQLLLLFFEIIFIVMIGSIGYVFYLPQQDNQNKLIKQWNQSLTATTMCYFDLSCKDQFIFNCIMMLKLYFQQLQIFTNVKMIVNEIILMMYDILLTYNVMRYTFVNDLLFHFMVFIFISMDITPAARTTVINNILLLIWFSVSIIEAPHIQKMKNLLHLNSSDDLYDVLNQDGITTNTGETKFECNIAITDIQSPDQADTAFLNQSEKQYLSISGVCGFNGRLTYKINYCTVFAHFIMLVPIMMKQHQIKKFFLLLIGMVCLTVSDTPPQKKTETSTSQKQKRKRIK